MKYIYVTEIDSNKRLVDSNGFMLNRSETGFELS